MKHLILFVAFVVATASSVRSQAPYKVVIDVTSADTLVHQMVLRWIGEITGMHPEAQVEVVLYGPAPDMVTQGRSVVAEGVKRYASGTNVRFAVCEVALRNRHIATKDLVSGVVTVPDGIGEIIQRQYEGWGYIKAAR